MSPIDFDTPVSRLGTHSVKWDKYRGQDIIPLWVADMDFRSPPAVIEALKKRVEHGVFGYTMPPTALVDVVLSMLHEDYGWVVEPEWLVWLPGLVTGLNVACRAVGEDGDSVVTVFPVYPPFLSAPKYSRRRLIRVPFSEECHQWAIDFERLEEAIATDTKLFLLCNPHNPVGRVFTQKELEALATVCERHNLVICSDEIHCGLVLDENRSHIPIATISAAVASRTITLMSPSKTFNLPGLGCSFAIIPDSRIRSRYCDAMAGVVPHVTVMGYVAALAAYRDSRNWHSALLAYLRENRELVTRAVRDMPGFSMGHVEGTYLAWIDARSAGLRDPALFFETVGVGLSDGKEFGGPGFVRLNFGCPRHTLAEALQRMERGMRRLTCE